LGLAVGRSQTSTARAARAQIARWADRFAWYAGLSWHYGEEFADDVTSDVASKYSALREKLVPAADEPLPTPSGVHEIAIMDEASAPEISSSQP